MFRQSENTSQSSFPPWRGLFGTEKVPSISRSIFGSLILAVLLGTRPAAAQTKTLTTYTVEKGSSLWFVGSSTVNTFTCRNKQVHGFGTIDSSGSLPQARGNTGSGTLNAFFYTSVRCLSCGVGPMDEDMYKALKASEYPDIHYALHSFRFIRDSTGSDSSFYVRTKGRLTVAGKTNELIMTVKVTRLPGGEFILEGSKPLSMHDYAITPPTALWGLIKAHDRLTVHFRLVIGLYGKNSPAPTTYHAVAHGSPPAMHALADSTRRR